MKRDLSHGRKVGARMRDLRLERGLTLRELHKLGGPTNAHMSAIENGKVDVLVATICYVARVLGVRPWQLLCDDPDLATLDLDTAQTVMAKRRKKGR